MAEGIELYDAFKKSKSIFMLAENYPQMKFNREIKRVCDGGTLGKIMYAEGEYNHPASVFDTDFLKRYNYFPEHWRNYLPRTYYVTHSLGPIMWATGATPKTVTAFSIFMPDADDVPSAKQNGDKASIITTLNDDGTVFKFTGCSGFGAHGNSYRVCGTKGQIENLRGMGEQVMLRYNEWDIPEGMKEINLYEPSWNDKDEVLINQSGHGGGDFLTSRMFLECIEKGVQPEHPFDIKSAIAMSSVAILAHRSVLEGGKPYAIPDFDNPEDRALYENDRLSPFVYSDGTQPTLPCCSHTDFKANEEQLRLYKEALGIK
jgi:predicted dehydrogenase